MSAKNLTKKRSQIRWKLSYQVGALFATWAVWNLLLAGLHHDWAQHAWLAPVATWIPVQDDFEYARQVVNATAMWLALVVTALMANEVRCLYKLMGLSIQAEQAAQKQARSYFKKRGPAKPLPRSRQGKSQSGVKATRR